jgi:hypothetical protein
MRVIGFIVFGLIWITCAQAQPPGGNPRGLRGGGEGGAEDPARRILSLDSNQNGTIEANEVSDTRLKSLFERADSDRNQILTRDEVNALVQKESGNSGRSRAGGRPGLDESGRSGFGGPNSGGPGGVPGGFGPPGMGMPKPGTVLPEFLVVELKLDEHQRKELSKLQETVDTQLAKILTKEQLDQLQQMGPGSSGPNMNEPGRRGQGGPNRGPQQNESRRRPN